jgi:O-antigen ligase
MREAYAGSQFSDLAIHPALKSYPAVARTRSRTSLYLFLVGLVMASGTVVLIEPAPIDIGLILLLAFGLLLNQLEFRGEHALPMLLLGLVAAANLCSIPEASDTGRAIWYGSVTLYLLCSWVFFVGLISKYGLRATSVLLKTYVLAGIAAALLSGLSYFHLIPFQDVLLLYGRPKGLFKDPNVYGPYMVPVALYALAKLNAKGLRAGLKLFWCCAYVVATSGVFLSFSRACWLNYAIGMIVYLILDLLGTARRDALRKMRNLTVVVVLVGATLVAVVNIPQVAFMMSQRWGSSGLQGYDEDRFETQRRALDWALEQPLGHGPGQAEVHFAVVTHSTYIRVLFENGILGFAPLALFLLLSLTRSVRLAVTARNTRWRMLFSFTAACIAGYVVNSAVIDTVHWRHVWLFLALAWTSHRAVDEPVVEHNRFAMSQARF